MQRDLLLRAGLSEREVRVYTALLKDGELGASSLARKTGLIRTNAYDVLNGLLRKGVVSYLIRNGKKYFRAAEPEKVLDFIRTQQQDLHEVEEEVHAILPQLRPTHNNREQPTF